MFLSLDKTDYHRLSGELISHSIISLFCGKEKTYSIEAVSKAMNLPCGTVLSILRRKGFDTRRGFRTPVTCRMRDVLADEYVKTLHSVFDTVVSDPVTNFGMVSTIISFFKIYKYDHCSDLENTLSWAKIDEDKIRQDFFNHVEQYDKYYNDSPCEDGCLGFAASRIKIGKSLLGQKPRFMSSILRCIYDLLRPAQWLSNYYHYDSYSDDRDNDVYYRVDLAYLKNQLNNNYKQFITYRMTSKSDPTSGRSQLLTPLTQRTSSGSFVRQVMLPHRYCIFGTSDDDDHISTHASECKSNYKHCSIGMGSLTYDTLYRRA